MTNQTLQTLWQVAIVVGILLTALGGFGNYIYGQRVQAEAAAKAAYSGRIDSNPKILLSTTRNIYPMLEFGDSGSMLMWGGPSGKPMFTIGGDPLTVEIDGDQLLVSAVLSTPPQKLGAE